MFESFLLLKACFWAFRESKLGGKRVCLQRRCWCGDQSAAGGAEQLDCS